MTHWLPIIVLLNIALTVYLVVMINREKFLKNFKTDNSELDSRPDIEPLERSFRNLLEQCETVSKNLTQKVNDSIAQIKYHLKKMEESKKDLSEYLDKSEKVLQLYENYLQSSRAISPVNNKYMEVVRLIENEKLSVAQVADQLNLPLGEVELLYNLRKNKKQKL